MVGNLLVNAVRHSPAGSDVRVEGGQDGEDAWLAVSDTCGGIPPADLDRVFDLAFRGEVARTPTVDAGAGAGLGLAIARGLVHAHHGEISVRNEGPGCRFEVRLPAAVRSAAQRRHVPQPRSGAVANSDIPSVKPTAAR